MLNRLVHNYEQLTGGRINEVRRFANYVIQGGVTPPPTPSTPLRPLPIHLEDGLPTPTIPNGRRRGEQPRWLTSAGNTPNTALNSPTADYVLEPAHVTFDAHSIAHPPTPDPGYNTPSTDVDTSSTDLNTSELESESESPAPPIHRSLTVVGSTNRPPTTSTKRRTSEVQGKSRKPRM